MQQLVRPYLIDNKLWCARECSAFHLAKVMQRSCRQTHADVSPSMHSAHVGNDKKSGRSQERRPDCGYSVALDASNFNTATTNGIPRFEGRLCGMRWLQSAVVARGCCAECCLYLHCRDVGVYVAITSLEPLLAYVHTGGVLLRFCSQDYVRDITPSTPTNTFVIYGLDDYMPASKSK